MARSDKKSRNVFINRCRYLSFDPLMCLFIVIVIKERVQPFIEFGTIGRWTNVHIIAFNCSPETLNVYIVCCTAPAIHTYFNILFLNIFCP